MKPNEQQQCVIKHVDGACLVVAVPGSGKTASMTERIKNLVRIGKDPTSILAITFTNKAADEMRRRISSAVGDGPASKMTISTFHSLCARIIRANSMILGLTKSYTIYDDDDQERMLRKAIFKIEGDGFSPSPEYWDGIRAFVEGKRNNLLTDEEASERYDVGGSQLKAAQEYLSSLASSNAVDFTGLLSETVRLFESHPEILAYYQKRFLYVNVDEVQDTNVAQYRLVKLIASHGNVMFIGDLDQSIYRWRGATPENVLQFEKDFDPVVLKLEKNYRSTPQILEPAHQLIKRNSLRKDTELVTDNADGDAPIVRRCPDDREMAMRIAYMAKNHLTAGVPPKEIAVFYRVNYVSRILEDALRALRIPYKVIGGQSFYARMEVKTCLAILKLMSNHRDRASFHRVVEFCCRGVGEKTIGDVIDEATGSKTVMQAAKERASAGDRIGKGLSVLVDAFEGKPREPHAALLHVARRTAFWDKMAAESRADNDRCANITELSEDVFRYVNDGGTLDGYLQNVSLISSADEEGKEKQIRLMTMHACKGLEFDVVLISHANQKIVPHKRVLEIESSTERGKQLEEERRLFYVAMTRAKKHLGIFHFQKRKRGSSTEYFSPSQFIGESGLRSY